MIHLIGGYLMGNVVPDDMRTRFAFAVMYGYIIGGMVFDDRLVAFATIMAMYGGMALNKKIKHMEEAKKHPHTQ